MRFKDFYEISRYGNEAWNGSYTEKEVAQNANDYYEDFLCSKQKGKFTFLIRELVHLLEDDGSDKCLKWARKIRYAVY